MPVTATSRSHPGIWPALLIAMGLHGLMLFLPFSKQNMETSPVAVQIELQLTKFEPPAVAGDIVITEPDPPPTPTPMPEDKPVPLVKTPLPAPAPTSPVKPLAPINRDLEHMNTAERTRLTHSILSSQFITEESAADLLFGDPIARYGIETRKEFQYPEQANMITMLDQPMQELPFEYTAGLIRFAYDPGVKGDLQRLWDIITPEFGWITDYGTQVKCKLILIIAGCAWK